MTQQNIENKILFSTITNGFEQGVSCCKPSYTKIQALKSRIFGNYGFNSRFETKRIIEELECFAPDVVLIHNIHGHDCHLEMLFSYFRRQNIRVIWTFHDCWAFTAYCTHFTFVKCNAWKSECCHCPQVRQYSWFFDRSKKLFQRKKRLLSGLDMTIVTPSQWLADLVKESFLKDYPVKVIHNGIDLSVFQPTNSFFREKNNIPIGKFVLLGVSFGWGERKGLDVFVELSKRLSFEKYQIVLVGTDDSLDIILPPSIISIQCTQNQKEMAEIYTAADLLINPTREDTYPTVNMESIACGTPVLTFKTGGSPEIVDDITGAVVECDDVDALVNQIEQIRREYPFSKETCARRGKMFDKSDRFHEYLDLLLD